MKTKEQIETEIQQIEQQQVQLAGQIQQLSAQLQQAHGRKNLLMELHDDILKDEGKVIDIAEGTTPAQKKETNV